METTLRVTGMTCADCARAVEGALNANPGVRATVSFEDRLAVVETDDNFDTMRLIETIKAKGYGVAPIKPSHPRGTATERAKGRKTMRIAIIGSGSAAFAGAIRAAEEGARVTLIESGTLGGTCVNVGCVPSKVMIRAATLAHLQKDHPFEGLERRSPTVRRGLMVAQQQKLVEGLRQAKYRSVLDSLPSVSLMPGMARFRDARTLVVAAPDGTEKKLRSDRVLIATGAKPVAPPITGLDETPYWTSTEALVADEVPGHLVVLGGSAVGLEIGQAFLRLGARVTLIELLALLPAQDADLGLGLRGALEREGMRVLTETETKGVIFDGTSFRVDLGSETITGDRLLVATGRLPNTGPLDLPAAGVEADRRGAIRIDDHMRTSAANVYAAGDCTDQPQLVYVAAAGGTRAAINMMGGDAALDLSVVPAVVFTDPQVATVGLSEAAARDRGVAVESRTLGLENVPRALVNFETSGFVKLVAEAVTGRLVGAHVLAPDGGEMIQTAALAIRHRMTVGEIAGELFPYLTMVEGLKLAAQTFEKDVAKLSCCAG